MDEHHIQYGRVRTVKELGKLIRAHRKSHHTTLHTVAGLGNVSMRFLSELERGKETAELGKALKAMHTLGLDVIVQPRRETPYVAEYLSTGGDHE